MSEFELIIDQHVRYIVTVEADSLEEAMETIASGMWDDSNNVVVTDNVQQAGEDGEAPITYSLEAQDGDTTQRMLLALQPLLAADPDLDLVQVAKTTFLAQEHANGYWFDDTAYSFDADSTEIGDTNVTQTDVADLLVEIGHTQGPLGHGYELVVDWSEGTVTIEP